MSDPDFDDTGSLDLEEAIDDDLEGDDLDTEEVADDEDADVGTDAEADEDADVEEEDNGVVLEDEDEDDEETEQSLDVLLVRETGEDGADRNGDRAGGVTAGIAADEFTCRSCFLVKKRAQVADEDALICFDCA